MSGPININTTNQGQGQGSFRMSFSPTGERRNDSYSGIVESAARSIFGSDDETYPAGQPSPLVDSRGAYEE
ncbi:hypothetical protein FRC14_006110, partial [Serendipita sp. 396]